MATFSDLVGIVHQYGESNQALQQYVSEHGTSDNYPGQAEYIEAGRKVDRAMSAYIEDRINRRLRSVVQQAKQQYQDEHLTADQLLEFIENNGI